MHGMTKSAADIQCRWGQSNLPGGGLGVPNGNAADAQKEGVAALKNCRPDALLAMWALLLILLAHGLRDAAVAHRPGPQRLRRAAKGVFQGPT